MHKIIFVALCSGVVLTPPLATPSLLSFSPPTTTPTGLNFSLSPLANGIIYIFLRSYCDLFHFSVPRLQYRPVRLNSQDTPRGGRIMDLDRGSITSVVLIKKSQVPIESTRLDDDNDNVFEEPAEVFDIQFLQ